MVDIKWAYLVPFSILVFFLALGYALGGNATLYDHYNLVTNNIVPILALTILYVFAISIWFRVSQPKTRVIHVQRVRTR